jgi:hypothetical protein
MSKTPAGKARFELHRLIGLVKSLAELDEDLGKAESMELLIKDREQKLVQLTDQERVIAERIAEARKASDAEMQKMVATAVQTAADHDNLGKATLATARRDAEAALANAKAEAEKIKQRIAADEQTAKAVLRDVELKRDLALKATAAAKEELTATINKTTEASNRRQEIFTAIEHARRRLS